MMTFPGFSVRLGLPLLLLALITGCTQDSTQSSDPPPPSAPSEFVAAQASFSRINLSWRDNSLDETGFQVERTTDTVSGVWQQCAVAARNQIAAQDTSFTGGTQYYYRVRAVSNFGIGNPSNVAQLLAWADLPAPQMSVIQVSHFAVRVTWTDESNAETSFRVERSPTRTSPSWPTLAIVGQDVTFMDDTLIAPSTTYFYRVRAENEHGQGPYSNTDSARTAPPFPATSGFVGTQHTRTLVDLNWNIDPLADSLRIEHSTDSTVWSVVSVLGPAVTAYHDNVGAENQLNFYRLCSLDSLGRSAYSPLSIWTWPAVYDFSTDQTGEFTVTPVNGTAIWQWDQQEMAGEFTISHPGSGGGLSRLRTNYAMPNTGWFDSKFRAIQWFGSGATANYAEFRLKLGAADSTKVFRVIFRRDSTFAGYYPQESPGSHTEIRLATNPQLPVVSESAWHRVQVFHRGNQWALYVDGTRCWYTNNLYIALGQNGLVQEWEFAQGNGPVIQSFWVDDVARDSDTP
jgi:hypothetical protein